MYHLTELTWPQFIQLPHIKKMQLHQQQIYYHAYLNEIAQQVAMMNALQPHAAAGGGGHLPTPSVTPTISLTPSVTPTISLTPSVTPTITPSPSV